MAAVAWIATQFVTLWAAKRVIQKAESRGDNRGNEITEHFDEKLDDVEGRMNGELESFEARFSEAYKEDMQALPGVIATQIKMTGMSEKGVETRALQAYLDKEGVDIDQTVEAAQGQFVAEHPEAMAAIALKRAYEADVSDAYRAENPIKAGIFDFAKASFLPQLEQAFMGTNTLGPRRPGSPSTKIYGT